MGYPKLLLLKIIHEELTYFCFMEKLVVDQAKKFLIMHVLPLNKIFSDQQIIFAIPEAYSNNNISLFKKFDFSFT